MTTVEILLTVIGSGGAASFLTALSVRKRTGAEAEKILGETYGQLISSCRAEIQILQARLNNQEARELRYLEIISTKDKTELGLRTRIKDLENEIKSLSSEITTLRVINNSQDI